MATALEDAPPGVDEEVGAGQDAVRVRGRRLAQLRQRHLRPLVVVPVVVVVAGAAAWWLARSSGSAPAAPAAVERTVAVTLGTMRQTVSSAGTLEPADSEDLNFTTSGQVTAVNVRAGQQVTKGTVLATIDSAALQSQVQQAQSFLA